MRFVICLFIVCAVVVIFDQIEVTQGREGEVGRHVRNYRNEEIDKTGRYHQQEKNKQKGRNHRKGNVDYDACCKTNCNLENEVIDKDGFCCDSMACCKPCNDTPLCKAEGGQCKSSCEENEEDTGSCCNEYRCCQPMATCNDTEDAICRDTCNIQVDEYIDITMLCSENTSCCRLCNKQCGGNFTGPMGSFFSPNYPSNYCNNQDCVYNITVNKGSIIMVNFLDVFLEEDGDPVRIYDGEIKPEALLDIIDVDQADEIQVNSTSNMMIIRFVSDESRTFAGFRVKYKAI